MGNNSAKPPIEVDIISGFLGAGKTTFINKLLSDGLASQDVVVIENELGDTPIDDALLDANDIRMRTLPSGCICCSLSADFASSVIDIVEAFAPKRIIVEPTGVAGASEIVRICEREIWQVDLKMNSVVTIVNALNLPEMLEMELEAFEKQIAEAHFVLLSRSQELEPRQLDRICDDLSQLVVPGTVIYRDAWERADALEILVLAEEAYSAHRAQPAASPSSAAGHAHGHGHGHDGLSTLSLRPQRALSAAQIEDITRRLEDGSAGTILRAKGFLESDAAGPVLYEYVYGSGKAVPSPRYADEAKMVVIGRDLVADTLCSIFGDAQALSGSHHGHH